MIGATTSGLKSFPVIVAGPGDQTQATPQGSQLVIGLTQVMQSGQLSRVDEENLLAVAESSPGGESLALKQIVRVSAAALAVGLGAGYLLFRKRR